MFRFGIYIFQDVNLVCPEHELLYHIHFSMDCPEIWSIESHVLYLAAAQLSEHNIQFWHFYCVYGILPPKQPSQCSNHHANAKENKFRSYVATYTVHTPTQRP